MSTEAHRLISTRTLLGTVMKMESQLFYLTLVPKTAYVERSGPVMLETGRSSEDTNGNVPDCRSVAMLVA